MAEPREIAAQGGHRRVFRIGISEIGPDLVDKAERIGESLKLGLFFRPAQWCAGKGLPMEVDLHRPICDLLDCEYPIVLAGQAA